MKTLFALDHTVREFDGKILELHTKVTPEEWEEIITSTLAYIAFMECSRDIACPTLKLPWSDNDAKILKKLISSSNRMRDIDPLLFAKLNTVDYKAAYSGKMQTTAPEVVKMADEIIKMQTEQDDIVSEIKGTL